VIPGLIWTACRKSGFIPLLLLALHVPRVEAQWQRTVDRLFADPQRPPSITGALCFDHKNLWGGITSLWKSADSGVTWYQITSFPVHSSGNADRIISIDFIDSLNGLVTTLGHSWSEGVYKTTDGGITWRPIYNSIKPSFQTTAIQALFAKNSQNIVVLEDTREVSVSSDGGSTWVAKGDAMASTGLWRPFAAVRHGDSAFVLCGLPLSVFRSADGGVTWAGPTTGVLNDTWGLAIDSCDSREMTVANENYYFREEDSLAHIYQSHDGGITYRKSFVAPIGGVSGLIGVGDRAVYSPSMTIGVYRSIDHQATWTSIGGSKPFIITR
jgi:hypothetical protein